jgi:hypothetical protein
LYSFEKLNAGILLAIAAILIAYFFSVEILKKGFFARHEI